MRGSQLGALHLKAITQECNKCDLSQNIEKKISDHMRGNNHACREFFVRFISTRRSVELHEGHKFTDYA